ncbi:MAG: acireductone synthase [Gammaproteobacteria bacterium]|nr:acireductone synthase [Gammaproteobacteria bacterium]
MIKAIITDIEGTTSSLSFVKDVLFPYARERMKDFVREHGHEPAVARLLDDVCHLVGREMSNEQVAEQLIQWIDEDRKVTPLKALQGLIWEAGYRGADFTGHVYEDAVRNLRQWNARGIKLYVFSSGSVYAQKLLFGHTEFGDLTTLFTDYFDTNVGAKQDPTAYTSIATSIGLGPGEILFLSDVKGELDAARQVGMRTTWLVRNGPIDPHAEHRQVAGFDDIVLGPGPLQ